MFPLYHDFDGETVLVFGGGPVGARKARKLAREARVVVVSPAFADRDFGDAERVREAPDADGVRDWVARTDPALVVAATDDAAVNDAAASAAREAGALVNRADRHGGADDDARVVMPAVVRDDPVVVSIATGGASPALSRELRRRVEADLHGAGAMADLTGRLRESLQARGVDPETRRNAVRAVVQSSLVWKALRSGDTNPRRVVQDVLGDELESTDDVAAVLDAFGRPDGGEDA